MWTHFVEKQAFRGWKSKWSKSCSVMSDLYDPMDYSLPGSSVCGLLQARTLEWGLFPGGSDGKESSCNVVDLGSIPGLGRSLEKGTANHYSILAWGIPWTDEPGKLYSPWDSKELDMTEWLSLHFTFHLEIEVVVFTSSPEKKIFNHLTSSQPNLFKASKNVSVPTIWISTLTYNNC